MYQSLNMLDCLPAEFITWCSSYPPFFQLSISMSPSSSLSQKGYISHPPPINSTNSDRVIADVIPGLDWSRSRFHLG
ncbi:hypothetical protein CEXT_415771 [Caerostris extrusa]|uniref:Uncharacterized protein n=1 Tax=Caerostris extrusa TaxID=172846 RepID=A0AAV4MFS1_CAEEX|nr:hypothetical protein CEXT_415771 [Caerostris extrusa]